mmetsp:Transcript_48797/g.114626  ORF Transcript_48797/g.114626 Transcript_48797/m.114626 type:complete len:362 (-) Transcript_48797:112-1197(-)
MPETASDDEFGPPSETWPLCGSDAVPHSRDTDASVDSDGSAQSIEIPGIYGLLSDRLWRSKTESEIARLQPQEVMDYLQECAEGREGLDSFQFLGFIWATRKRCDHHVVLVCLKCLLCVCVQLPGTIMILQELHFESNHPETGRCEEHEIDLLHMLMLGLLGSFEAMFFLVRYRSIVYSGMYRLDLEKMNNIPDFVRPGPVIFGRVYNMLCYSTMCWSSLHLLYHAPNMLEMILNCVALDFMVEMDNMMVTSADYHKLQKHILSEKQRNELHQGGLPPTRWHSEQKRGSRSVCLCHNLWSTLHLLFLLIIMVNCLPGMSFLITGLVQLLANCGRPCTRTLLWPLSIVSEFWEEAFRVTEAV